MWCGGPPTAFDWSSVRPQQPANLSLGSQLKHCAQIRVRFALCHSKKAVEIGVQNDNDPLIARKEVVAHHKTFARNAVCLSEHPSCVMPQAPNRCLGPTDLPHVSQFLDQEVEHLRIRFVET